VRIYPALPIYKSDIKILQKAGGQNKIHSRDASEGEEQNNIFDIMRASLVK